MTHVFGTCGPDLSPRLQMGKRGWSDVLVGGTSQSRLSNWKPGCIVGWPPPWAGQPDARVGLEAVSS